MPEPVGFYTDTTVCIGCKACQVACHEWNELPSKFDARHELPVLSGNSYDNTVSLSDVCKHCVNAPCLEVCPTGAILRTEFDTVYINPPACNGCRDCISACPFGVIHMSETENVAKKCTFCYDRLQHGLTPACAQACPTQSIRFGPLKDLKTQA